jgi:hypothetical protein
MPLPGSPAFPNGSPLLPPELLPGLSNRHARSYGTLRAELGFTVDSMADETIDF